MKMKVKLGWLILLSFFFYGKKVNAQLAEKSLRLDHQYLRYGFGIGAYATVNGTSIDLELGYTNRYNTHLSGSAILNYGFVFEYGEVVSLQSHLSTIAFFSPFDNRDPFVFEIGIGLSSMATYHIYHWDSSRNGVAVGGCMAIEFSYFSEKREKFRNFNVTYGRYTKNQILFGFTMFSEISFNQMRRDRKKQKEKFGY